MAPFVWLWKGHPKRWAISSKQHRSGYEEERHLSALAESASHLAFWVIGRISWVRTGFSAQHHAPVPAPERNTLWQGRQKPVSADWGQLEFISKGWWEDHVKTSLWNTIQFTGQRWIISVCHGDTDNWEWKSQYCSHAATTQVHKKGMVSNAETPGVECKTQDCLQEGSKPGPTRF